MEVKGTSSTECVGTAAVGGGDTAGGELTVTAGGGGIVGGELAVTAGGGGTVGDELGGMAAIKWVRNALKAGTGRTLVKMSATLFCEGT